VEDALTPGRGVEPFVCFCSWARGVTSREVFTSGTVGSKFPGHSKYSGADGLLPSGWHPSAHPSGFYASNHLLQSLLRE
jgi:hypothetical protein